MRIPLSGATHKDYKIRREIPQRGTTQPLGLRWGFETTSNQRHSSDPQQQLSRYEINQQSGNVHDGGQGWACHHRRIEFSPGGRQG